MAWAVKQEDAQKNSVNHQTRQDKYICFFHNGIENKAKYN